MKNFFSTIKHVSCLLFLVALMTACKPTVVPPVVNANTPAPAATSTNYTDTTTWETYRNDEYGFEFKYPASYIDLNSTHDTVSWYDMNADSSCIGPAVIKSKEYHDQISITFYPSTAERGLVKKITDGVNEGIFSYALGKNDSAGGKYYFLDSYNTAEGSTTNYLRLFYFDKKNGGVVLRYRSLCGASVNQKRFIEMISMNFIMR